MRGLIVGVPLVLAANLARLVSLFFIGVHRRQAFDFAHLVLWEAAMVLVILAVWIWCFASPGDAPGGAEAQAGDARHRAGGSGVPDPAWRP